MSINKTPSRRDLLALGRKKHQENQKAADRQAKRRNTLRLQGVRPMTVDVPEPARAPVRAATRLLCETWLEGRPLPPTIEIKVPWPEHGDVQPSDDPDVPAASPSPACTDINGTDAGDAPTAPPADDAPDKNTPDDPPPDHPFFDRDRDQSLSARMQEMARYLGPVPEDTLFARFSKDQGFGRCGRRIQERLRFLAEGLPRTEEAGRVFLWPPGADIHHVRAFRDPGPGEPKRPVRDIATAELVALASEVLAAGLAEEAAVQEMKRRVGIKALRANTRQRLVHALGAAEAYGPPKTVQSKQP